LFMKFLSEMTGDADPSLLANISFLYLYATQKLLLRNIQMGRTFTTIDAKLSFLTELAHELYTSGRENIHYSEIPSLLKLQVRTNDLDGPGAIDQWDYDLRTQTLLHRDAAGNYEFAHKSFVEYFVALKVARDIGVLKPLFSRVYGVDSARKIAAPPLQELSQTFGRFALSDPRMWVVRAFLRGMVDPRRAAWLWKLVLGTRDKPPGQVGFLGGNAATLLNDLGESFSGRDLSRTVLSSADFSGADMRFSRLDGAYLEKTRLSDAYLRDASFARALMADTFFDHIGGVKALAFVNDDKGVVSGGSDGRIDLWHLGRKNPIRVIDRYSAPITDIATSPNGRRLAVSALDGTVSIWGLPKLGRKRIVNLGGVSSICFSPDGLELAVARFHEGSVAILDLGLMRVTKELRPPSSRVGYQVSYSPDGRYVALAHNLGGVVVWDCASQRLVGSIGNHESKVESVCFTHDGEFVVSAGYDKLLKVWRVGTWELVSQLRDGGTIPVILPHPKDNLIATGLHGGGVTLWDIESSRKLSTLKTGHGHVYAMSFSKDGKWLITGGQDASIRLWDSERNRCVSTFRQALSCPGLNLTGVRKLNRETQAILKLRGAVVDGKPRGSRGQH